MVYKTTHCRAAFTMIELILIIVIIGILVAIALPKLSAVRDDANIAKDVSNMAVCIRDAASHYTSTGIDIKAGDSKSCDNVVCYTITYANGSSDFTVTTNASAAPYCSTIDSFGAHLAKIYTFKGSRISL